MYLQDPKPDDGVYLKLFISSCEIEESSIILPFNIPSIPFKPAKTLLKLPKVLFASNNPTTLELITDVGPPDCAIMQLLIKIISFKLNLIKLRINNKCTLNPYS